MYEVLREKDPEVFQAIQEETERQMSTLELIASENFASQAIFDALGSPMNNKYAEGYPQKRYYGGCQFMDRVETLAQERAKRLFGADHVNVQPHSGSQANMAVYMAELQPGDTIMGMNLSHGGHLTHGHPINFSGILYTVVSYGVEQETEQLDYVRMQELAESASPKLIVVGASAYPRTLDFARVQEIADSIGAVVMADIAHIAGLIVADLHPSPVPHAQYVTTTTHKTLRGPRAGMVMCQEPYAERLDKILFPGIQGGPLMHVIAAKAVCFEEALKPSFRAYQEQVVRNAQALARTLAEEGFRIVSGGTDTHLFLVDVFEKGLTGKIAEESLEKANITVNKNTIPFDTQKPFIASGIRIGTPAVTTRGMGESEMQFIGTLIADVLRDPDNTQVQNRVREKVLDLCDTFAFYDIPGAGT